MYAFTVTFDQINGPFLNKSIVRDMKQYEYSLCCHLYFSACFSVLVGYCQQKYYDYQFHLNQK